jgi:hypothetical protein
MCRLCDLDLVMHCTVVGYVLDMFQSMEKTRLQIAQMLYMTCTRCIFDTKDMAAARMLSTH